MGLLRSPFIAIVGKPTPIYTALSPIEQRQFFGDGASEGLACCDGIWLDTAMQQYLDLMARILDEGVERMDRTGTGTRGVFGHQMRFNLQDGFPLVTTKKLHVKSIIHEMLWFLSGATNIAYLKENGVTIWDAWADENGELGPVYGAQWRSWPSSDGRRIDQIAALMARLKSEPSSRRHIVTAWNPSEIDAMALPPCHCLFQFHVAPDGDNPPRLSCQLYQRSADVFLGVPFNIAGYALLTHILAHALDYAVGDFVHTLGDAHLYLNHLEQARTQLTRTPRPLPRLWINPEQRDVFALAYDDFRLDGYAAAPHIAAPVAV